MNIKQKVWLKLQQMSIYIYIFSNQSFESIDYLYYPANISLDGDALKTSWIHCSSSSSEDVFKTSWSRPIYYSWQILKPSLRCFQDVFKTFCKTAFETSSRGLQDVLKISSRRLQDIFKTSCKDIFKTFLRCIIK